MKKGYTIGGNAGYRMSVKTMVTETNFVTALAEHVFDGEEIDYQSLTKTEAKSILMDRLQYHGRNGRWEAFDGDMGTDSADQYNECLENAREWVNKNYPYLKTTRKE